MNCAVVTGSPLTSLPQAAPAAAALAIASSTFGVAVNFALSTPLAPAVAAIVREHAASDAPATAVPAPKFPEASATPESGSLVIVSEAAKKLALLQTDQKRLSSRPVTGAGQDVAPTKVAATPSQQAGITIREQAPGGKTPLEGTAMPIATLDVLPIEHSILPGVLAAQAVAPSPRDSEPSRKPTPRTLPDQDALTGNVVPFSMTAATAPELLLRATLPPAQILPQLPSQPITGSVRPGSALGSIRPQAVTGLAATTVSYAVTSAPPLGADSEGNEALAPVLQTAERAPVPLQVPIATPQALAEAPAAMSAAAAAVALPLERANVGGPPPRGDRPDGGRAIVGAKATAHSGGAAPDQAASVAMPPHANIDSPQTEAAPGDTRRQALASDRAVVDLPPDAPIALAAVPRVEAPPHNAMAQDIAPSVRSPAAASPAEPLVSARPGQIGHEVGVEIARRVSAGGDELIVRLVPAELGRIEVRMSFDDRGGLRAVIAADSPVALDMLRRDSADLSRALSDAGVRSDAQSLRFQTDGGSGGGTNQQRSPWRDADPRTARDEHGSLAIDTDITSYRPLRTSGRYDLLA